MSSSSNESESSCSGKSNPGVSLPTSPINPGSSSSPEVSPTSASERNPSPISSPIISQQSLSTLNSPWQVSESPSPNSSPPQKRPRPINKLPSRSTLERRLRGADSSASSDDADTPSHHKVFTPGESVQLNNNSAEEDVSLLPSSPEYNQGQGPGSPQSDRDDAQAEIVHSDGGSFESTSDDESVSSSGSTQILCREISGSDSEMYSTDTTHYSNSVTSSDSSEDSDSEVSTRLFNGSSVSINEAILRIFKLYIQERWTKNSLNKNVKLIKGLLPQPNELPSSGAALMKKLQQFSAFERQEKHFYCSKCQTHKDNNCDVCNKCGCSETGVFYTFSLEAQVRYMFEQQNLASIIEYQSANRKHEDGHICDVQDGSEYLRVQSKLTGQNDLVLMFNTDGVSLSTSSKQQLWANLCVICSLPPQLRSSFIIINSVYVDKHKPDMNLYLKPFVDSLVKISNSNGVSWKHPVTKEICFSKVVAPILCADAPAKAAVLNVKQYNGRFGCNTCEQKTKKVHLDGEYVGDGAQRRVRTKRCFIFQEESARLRTGDRMDLQGRLAEFRRKSRKGVIGNSIVSLIPLFDRALSICAEYLHTLCLGVVKYFLHLFFFVRGPWFIGNHLDAIDDFIHSIKVPDFVKRLPRGLSDFSFFKGSEFRAFLLYYSLPALSPYLPPQYLQHWLLLVGAIYLLLGDSISEDDLKAAQIMLKCFVRDIHYLFEDKFFTYNVHNLLHLPLLVRRWGPLWATSAFIFEKFNGYITSHVHGTKNLGKELFNNISIVQSVSVLENIVNDPSLQYLPIEIEEHSKLEFSSGPLQFNLLTALEKLPILEANIENFQIYARIKVGRETYTSRGYDSDKKRADSFIQFNRIRSCGKNDSEYGQILYFIKCGGDNFRGERAFCLVNVYTIVHTDIFFHVESRFKLKHLIPVADSGELILLSPKNIVSKVLKAGKYLCIRPNPFEINL